MLFRSGVHVSWYNLSTPIVRDPNSQTLEYLLALEKFKKQFTRLVSPAHVRERGHMGHTNPTQNLFGQVGFI